MQSKLKKIKKNWFTMLELVFVCTVFAMLVSWIILAINRTFVFMNNTKVQIRATNLAREWMEMMFNIRDTNRRKCSWQKDQFWLYLGSWASADGCNPGTNIFQKWIYTIKEWRINGTTTWDRFIYAENLGFNNDEIIEKFYWLEDDWFFADNPEFNGARSWSMVTFTWTYTYLSWGDVMTGEIWDLLGNWVEFYRIVRVYGIYKKDDDLPNTPADLTPGHYSDPKEMRFCVKVFYKMGVWTHSSELCSIMTNFME